MLPEVIWVFFSSPVFIFFSRSFRSYAKKRKKKNIHKKPTPKKTKQNKIKKQKKKKKKKKTQKKKTRKIPKLNFYFFKRKKAIFFFQNKQAKGS